MTLFSPSSRYAKHAEVRAATDRNGRSVHWVTPARVPPQTVLGEHRRKDGQRLDRIAAHYCGDPTGFWRVALVNDGMSADAVAERTFIKVPKKGS